MITFIFFVVCIVLGIGQVYIGEFLIGFVLWTLGLVLVKANNAEAEAEASRRQTAVILEDLVKIARHLEVPRFRR